MTLAVSGYEEINTIPAVNCANSVQVQVSSKAEIMSEINSASFYSLISITGMPKATVTVSKFVAEKFSAVKNVQAVLAGVSGDVLHIWVMIDEWTPDVRKQVYTVQQLVMKQLEGLFFDFYVVDLPDGMSPKEMVSDIPLIFNRAEQESTSTNCQ